MELLNQTILFGWLIFPVIIILIALYLAIRKIASLKQTQKALIETETKYRNLVEDSLNGIFIVQDGKFVYANPEILKLSGYPMEEIVGSVIDHHIFPEDLPLVKENISRNLASHIHGIRFQYRALKKDQSLLFLDMHAAKTAFNGKPAVIGSVIDITEQKKAEETIQHMAYHDALTGLPNRNKFYSCSKEALANEGMTNAALLYLNLDRFKIINETLGHDNGDLLLKEVAFRLKERVRPEDCLARLGGDEFIIFFPNANNEDADAIAHQIIDSFNDSFLFRDYEVYLTPSVGVSLFPQDNTEIESLIKKADLAMRQAKRIEKSNLQFYDKTSERTNHVFTMESDLRKAIERGEFIVYYQPKVNTRTGKIYGMEALIRWQHPEKGLISPGQFIPLAEETGMIVSIGEWVLRTACTQTISLHKKSMFKPVVSVNLSVRQFYQPNLIKTIREILEETGLPSNYLEVEITESMMIDAEHALKIVGELKEMGVRVSLDDFGTGYSSLHYLNKFPIDIIKIDQSFIRDCAIDSNNETIVKAIIAMAHQLKIDVISEGVETKEQLHFLQQHACNNAQGYLFSRPLPLEEIEENYLAIEQIVKG